MNIRILLAIFLILVLNVNNTFAQRSFDNVVDNSAITIPKKQKKQRLQPESYVTEFLGIPVDGSKSNMLWNLKNKGFKPIPYHQDILEGEFNGYDVNIHIVTNKNKVWRIFVADKIKISESAIKTRFNNLCLQFENNSNYISYEDSQLIPDSEDISYEILVNDKKYTATYYQTLPSSLDSVKTQRELLELMQEKFTVEELSNMTEEEYKSELSDIVWEYTIDLYTSKMVWFTIVEYQNEYYIGMYYDNLHNAAKGEDL